MIGRLGALWLALAAMSIAGLSARAQIAVEPVDPSQRANEKLTFPDSRYSPLPASRWQTTCGPC